MLSPTIVLHFRRRADCFFGAARDLECLDAPTHGPAIGLLAIHGCIALADAVLVAVEGTRGKGDDHSEAARRLRAWCSTQHLTDSGVKHLEWLVGRKNHFSYDEQEVREEELQHAYLKMERFFAWTFRSFPAVAQLTESHHA